MCCCFWGSQCWEHRTVESHGPSCGSGCAGLSLTAEIDTHTCRHADLHIGRGENTDQRQCRRCPLVASKTICPLTAPVRSCPIAHPRRYTSCDQPVPCNHKATEYISDTRPLIVSTYQASLCLHPPSTTPVLYIFYLLRLVFSLPSCFLLLLL